MIKTNTRPSQHPCANKQPQGCQPKLRVMRLLTLRPVYFFRKASERFFSSASSLVSLCVLLPRCCGSSPALSSHSCSQEKLQRFSRTPFISLHLLQRAPLRPVRWSAREGALSGAPFGLHPAAVLKSDGADHPPPDRFRCSCEEERTSEDMETAGPGLAARTFVSG